MAARVLVFHVWQDIMRFKITYMLVFFVIISAFSVVYYSHINRQTTSNLEVLLARKDELNIEWRNLLLEQNSSVQLVKAVPRRQHGGHKEIIHGLYKLYI